MNLKKIFNTKKLNKVSDDSNKGIQLPNSNLFFYGTKFDTNGNRCAVFSFNEDGRKWSVQIFSFDINKGGLHMPSNSKPQDIIKTDADAAQLEKNVVEYINNYGSKRQQDELWLDKSYNK